MNELEKRLQERLEQLEAGESLELCLAGLPAAEAELLKLTVSLRDAAYPVLDGETAVSQRASLQQSVINMNQNASQAGLGARLLTWWQALTTSRRGAVAALASLAIILFIVGLGGLFSSDAAQGPAGLASKKDEDGSESIAQALPPDTDSSQEIAPVEDAPLPNALFIPMVAFPLNRTPQTAVLENIQGVVEIQMEDGKWTAVSRLSEIAAGQRIRTSALSTASLTFYDGSQAALGPNTELSLDTLDAQQPENGFRTIVMTEWLGESTHSVQFRNDSGSRYEVKTPSGTGIARGTTFEVLVTADLRAQYAVTEGRVDVTGIDANGDTATVSVTAGKISAIPAGETPSAPTFRVTGDGVVSQTGSEWIIGGQTFQTDDHTRISGDPQVGDWVRVEGHLLADGTRLADQITLLRHSPADSFTIAGLVDTMGDTSWIVAGQTITVNEATDIADGIAIGDSVQVDGRIQADGNLLAERIRLIETEPGDPFEFIGVVESMDEPWFISGVAIATDANTEIKDDIAIGDVVKVEGWILEDGSWMAQEIKLVEIDENRFEFTGEVESMAPWVVAGISFETRDWTEIEDGIAIGDLVKVEGVVLEDGTWVADEIKLLDEDDHLTFEFYGTVDSIDPWLVSGIPLAVTEETAVDDNIEVGDLVKVTVTILPDGSWVVEQIILVNDAGEEEGCFSVTAVVISISDDQLTVDGWPVFQLGDEVEIDGEITAGSIITIYACIGEDGTLAILEIIVLYNPDETPPAPPPPPPPPAEGKKKVTLCHNTEHNPHTITVAGSAVPAHLNHGDTLGPCP